MIIPNTSQELFLPLYAVPHFKCRSKVLWITGLYGNTVLGWQTWRFRIFFWNWTVFQPYSIDELSFQIFNYCCFVMDHSITKTNRNKGRKLKVEKIIYAKRKVAHSWQEVTNKYACTHAGKHALVKTFLKAFKPLRW